jgi:hypothetical protein
VFRAAISRSNYHIPFKSPATSLLRNYVPDGFDHRLRVLARKVVTTIADHDLLPRSRELGRARPLFVEQIEESGSSLASI